MTAIGHYGKNPHPFSWRAHILEHWRGAIGCLCTTEDRAPTRYPPTTIQGRLIARCWEVGIYAYSSRRNGLHEVGLSIETSVSTAQMVSSVENFYPLPQVTGSVERILDICTCDDALIQFATETAKGSSNLMGTSPLCIFYWGWGTDSLFVPLKSGKP
jgi:hypothetical protein